MIEDNKSLADYHNDQIKELRNALVDFLSWGKDASCPDCFQLWTHRNGGRSTCIHAFDCGYLEARNKALALLGRPLEEGHHEVAACDDSPLDRAVALQVRWEKLRQWVNNGFLFWDTTILNKMLDLEKEY